MSQAKQINLPQNSIIIREGEANTDMYKILKGHAEIYVGYETPSESILGIIGEQACFGEFGILLGKASIYTVKAYSDVLAMRITQNDLGNFVQENQRNIINIMQNMANSMMTMKVQIDMLLKELQTDCKAESIDLKEKIREARRMMRQYAIYKPEKNSPDIPDKSYMDSSI